MAGLDLSSYAKMLKVMYPQKRVTELVYKNFPFLALAEKVQGPGPGSSLDVVMRYSALNTRSADWATSRAAAIGSGAGASPAFAKFSITLAQNHAHGFIDHLTLKQSETDPQAFARAMDVQVKAMHEAMRRDIAFGLFHSSTGIVGVIDTIDTGANTIKFTKRSALRALDIGVVLVSSANADMSSPNANKVTISAIDTETGTVTYTGTDTSWANGHYVTADGDANAKFKGLADWLPSGSTRDAALAASFFGQVRSAHKTKLGGIRFDASDKSTVDALTLVAYRLVEEEAEPTICLMNPVDYAQLCVELQSRAVHATVSGTEAKLGYTGIKIVGLPANMTIIPDPSCHESLVYMLDMSTWHIAKVGQNLVNDWNDDSNAALRISEANGLLMSIYSYMNIYSDAPGKNAVIELA
jgi:hypothetical protein